MTLLIAGVLLWTFAHIFKRALPGMRADLTERFGNASKGIFALLILASIALMVLGYRMADFTPVYTPPVWAVHLNNLLMLLAIAFLGMGHSKGRMRSWFRHPMLIGTAIWAVAHLLVNGDLASMVLFGGLFGWTLIAMSLINIREPDWERPEPGPVSGDIRLGVITLVLFGIIAFLHQWIGPWPFPS